MITLLPASERRYYDNRRCRGVWNTPRNRRKAHVKNTSPGGAAHGRRAKKIAPGFDSLIHTPVVSPLRGWIRGVAASAGCVFTTRTLHRRLSLFHPCGVLNAINSASKPNIHKFCNSRCKINKIVQQVLHN